MFEKILINQPKPIKRPQRSSRNTNLVAETNNLTVNTRLASSILFY